MAITIMIHVCNTERERERERERLSNKRHIRHSGFDVEKESSDLSDDLQSDGRTDSDLRLTNNDERC